MFFLCWILRGGCSCKFINLIILVEPKATFTFFGVKVVIAWRQERKLITLFHTMYCWSGAWERVSEEIRYVGLIHNEAKTDSKFIDFVIAAENYGVYVAEWLRGLSFWGDELPWGKFAVRFRGKYVVKLLGSREKFLQNLKDVFYIFLKNFQHFSQEISLLSIKKYFRVLSEKWKKKIL